MDIDMDERVRDRLLRKGIQLGSRDLFNFWEITGGISETVQDRT